MHPETIPKQALLSPHMARRMLGYGLLLLLSLGTALALLLWQDRAVRHRHGQEQVKAIASGAERALRRELAILERVMTEFTINARYLSRTMPAHLPQLLAERVTSVERSNPGLRDLRFSTTLPAYPGLATTGYSTVRSGGRMRIGRPRNVAGIGWVLPLALPIPGAVEGEPAWVIASLRVDALERVAVDLNLGSDGVANIMHRDGWMVVRSRDGAKWVGAPLRDPELFRQRLPRAHAGVVNLPSPLDGVHRIAAYRVLPDYPLLVVVGMARAEALQGWGKFALTASVLGGLLLVLWLALLGVVLRARERQQQLTDSLRRTAEKLAETRRIAGIGDWSWEVDTGRVTWSEEIYTMHGLAPQAGSFHIGSIPQRIHPDDIGRRKQQVAELVAGDGPAEIQYRILRTDDAVRTIRARGEWSDRRPGHRVLRGIQQDITDLAQARADLLRSQDEYRFLFENNPLPMWVFERETLRFLAVNDAMLRLYGYQREEVLAMSTLDVCAPEDVEVVRDAVRLQAADRPQGKAWTHRRRDGIRIRVSIYSHDIVFEGRDARLVLAQDVTEREITEQRFRLVARATSDAVYDLDIDNAHLWWSDSFYSVFGFTREQVPPTLQAWEDLLHPDDLARVDASLSAAIADPGISEWEEEYRFRRSDASYADVTDRGFLQRDENGRAVRMVGGMLDVTQKHRYEADLRLLRRAVEATENGIVIADACRPDMPVVYVNPAFEEMTGYPAAEILGSNCRVLQGEDRAQPGLIAIRHALREVREVRTTLRNYRKDGVPFWNEFRLAPVRDEAGSLTHFVGVLTDVTERQRAEEQMAFRATHDELTGLPNRRLLLDRLQQAIFHAGRYGREVAVVFIDLDDFKLINDSFGHTAGDAALHVVGQRLQALVRETDTVGRFGGDEFVVVLTEQTDEAGLKHVIRRINDALSVPIEVAGVAHTLTPSIGHCRYPADGADAEAMLMRADLAMYQAKRQGRNRAVAYRPEFDETVSQRLQLVAQLREGLERKEFALVFQPLFDCGGRPVALEALVRWQHPERGLLVPAHFITVCEESGLIVELGRRVLHEAARHYPLLVAAGWGHLRIAVNVSAAQFAHDLFAHVAEVVSEFSLPPGVLELELTESVIMDNPELAIATMQRIAESGVCLSVDDFGTGYSSLAYLKRLPINRLKIDRSFVQDLATDPDDAAICAAIISMAHSLELQTVAEGVETVEQMRWLHARGCDELQGFLLGRPAGFDEVLRALDAARGATPT